ncbi:MAG TPA: GNAT family N-acetyltransferase [Patescibacteria group bacterium]
MIRRINNSDKKSLIKLFKEFHEFNNSNLVSDNLRPFHEYKDAESTFTKEAEEYINKEEFVVFVADINGQIVGYCAAKISNKPERVLNKEAYFEDWFVSENYKGRGIGKELFEALTTEVKKLGCTHIKLDAFTSNIKAIDYYHKDGFIDDTLVMYKNLI